MAGKILERASCTCGLRKFETSWLTDHKMQTQVIKLILCVSVMFPVIDFLYCNKV